MREEKSLKILLILFFLFLTSLFLILPNDVYAYLDPGSGSYILQLVAAFLFGAIFMGKVFWQKIKTFFINLFLRVKKNDNVRNNQREKRG